MISVLLGSGNTHKYREISQILKDLPIKLVSLSDLDSAPNVIEDGDTFEANAAKKACELARWSKMITMADDSGICVDFLDGNPGVYSARYAGAERDDDANNAKMLEEMSKVPADRRGGGYYCALAIASAEGELLAMCSGECRGMIARDLVGSGGFGYDPLFIDPETGLRFAELEPDHKNRISHRAKALIKAREFFEQYLVGHYEV